jgi:cytochrome d ubiquinol oxidase subunit I
MVGVGVVVAALTAYGLLLLRRRRLETSPRYLRLLSFAIALPILANATGWIFTEMGRQPWVVQGLLKTSNAVSPSVSAWEVGLTLAVFTLLYGALAAVDGLLMFGAARTAPASAPSETDGASPEAARSLSMAY